jgi:hypothetical protein
MFPKKGNVFPNADGEVRLEVSYRQTIAAALHRELGDTHRAVKTTMRWTGASERTAKNWIAGSHGPSGEHLIALMRHSDEVLIGLLTLAGRDEAIVALRLVEMRDRLEETRQLIDALIDREGGGEGRTSGPS